MKFEELEQNVIEWARQKGIDTADDWRPQFRKMEEELGEFKEELKFNEVASWASGRNREMTELGDLIVTAIIMAEQRQYSINECLEKAYNKIKDRTGQVVDGVFVKDPPGFKHGKIPDDGMSLDDLISKMVEEKKKWL